MRVSPYFIVILLTAMTGLTGCKPLRRIPSIPAIPPPTPSASPSPSPSPSPALCPPSSFGTGGIVSLAIPKLHRDRAHGRGTQMRMQADGKLIVGGTFKDGGRLSAFLQRLNCDGTVDPTFNQGNLLSLRFDNETTLTDFVVQPDGKTLGTGYSRKGNQTDSVIFRVNSHGVLDTTFGPGNRGYNNEPLESSPAAHIGAGLRVLANQTIAVLVNINDSAAGFAFYSSAGILASFQKLASGRDVQPLILAPSDSLLWGGACFGTTPLSCGVLSRFADPAVVNSNRSVPQALLPLDDGKILAIGSSQTGSDGPQATLSRHLPDFMLDPTFGQAGTVIGPPRHAWLNSGSVQTNGRIVVVGATQISSSDAPTEFSARFLPDGSPDPSFAGAGPSLALQSHTGQNSENGKKPDEGSFLDSVLSRDSFLFVQGADVDTEQLRIYRLDAAGNPL